MKEIPTQMTLDMISDHYQQFVDKFKPKKTTDDCYTPENIFEAVKGWVLRRYDLKPEQIVRPFWPGGDYQRYEYKDTDVVLDNPPFSILTEIINFYLEHEIPFFLFAPTLTNFTTGLACCHVIENVSVTYENGAEVNTSFVTNLEKDLVVLADPELFYLIKEANKANLKKVKKTVPKFSYPPNVLSASMVGWIVSKGVGYQLKKSDAFHIRVLESQIPKGKSIFGSGFLLSEKAAAEKAAAEKAAAEKAAAEKWTLSPRELQIIKELSK